MQINKITFLQLLIFAVIAFSNFRMHGQEKPPTPVKVEVNPARWLNFGSFTSGLNGGTVTVDFSGKRTATGEIQLLNFGTTPSSALFDVTAIPGAVIQINAPTNVPLTGSNGGTIYLNIDSYSTGQIFVHSGNANTPTPVEFGGTLTMGTEGANPPGHYNGTVTLTFINQ